MRFFSSWVKCEDESFSKMASSAPIRDEVAAAMQFNITQPAYLRFECEKCHGEAAVKPDGMTIVRCRCDRGLKGLIVRLYCTKRPTRTEVLAAGGGSKWADTRLDDRYRRLLHSSDAQGVPIRLVALDDPVE